MALGPVSTSAAESQHDTRRAGRSAPNNRGREFAIRGLQHVVPTLEGRCPDAQFRSRSPHRRDHHDRVPRFSAIRAAALGGQVQPRTLTTALRH